MAYTDLTNTFDFDHRISYQDFTALANNDAFLKTNYANYRRPTVKKTISGANLWVEIEPNGSADNQTSVIMFPDGNLRSVSESRSFVSGTTRYVAALAGNTARLSGGSSGGGNGFSLGLGAPVFSNAWVACYATKVTDDATKFVLVLANVAPIRANYATINTALGTNSWVFLGLVRYGEGTGNNTTLLNQQQSGNRTMFVDEYASGNTTPRAMGFEIATTSGATSLTYTYAAGMGAAQIPNNVTHVCLAVMCNSGSSPLVRIENSGTGRFYGGGGPITNGLVQFIWLPAAEGLKVTSSASIAIEIALVGWVDGALGVGYNPVL